MKTESAAVKTTMDWWMRPESSLKVFHRTAAGDADCAAYREALKNVMRSPAKDRVKIAKKALFGKGVKQRGRELLKLAKAAVQFCYILRNGDQKAQMKALRGLEQAYVNFKAKGATASGWLKVKGLKNAP